MTLDWSGPATDRVNRLADLSPPPREFTRCPKPRPSDRDAPVSLHTSRAEWICYTSHPPHVESASMAASAVGRLMRPARHSTWNVVALVRGLPPGRVCL